MPASAEQAHLALAPRGPHQRTCSIASSVFKMRACVCQGCVPRAPQYLMGSSCEAARGSATHTPTPAPQHVPLTQHESVDSPTDAVIRSLPSMSMDWPWSSTRRSLNPRGLTLLSVSGLPTAQRNAHGMCVRVTQREGTAVHPIDLCCTLTNTNVTQTQQGSDHNQTWQWVLCISLAPRRCVVLCVSPPAVCSTVRIYCNRCFLHCIHCSHSTQQSAVSHRWGCSPTLPLQVPRA